MQRVECWRDMDSHMGPESSYYIRLALVSQLITPLEFVVAFFACLKVGLIAIPLAPSLPGTASKDLPLLGRLLDTTEARMGNYSPAMPPLRKVKSGL